MARKETATHCFNYRYLPFRKSHTNFVRQSNKEKSFNLLGTGSTTGGGACGWACGTGILKLRAGPGMGGRSIPGGGGSPGGGGGKGIILGKETSSTTNGSFPWSNWQRSPSTQNPRSAKQKNELPFQEKKTPKQYHPSFCWNFVLKKDYNYWFSTTTWIFRTTQSNLP